MSAVDTAAPAAPPVVADAPEIDQENPWPGLVSFPEAAERFFNGRDAERDELLRLIDRETLTLLYGGSGLGKSSLLMAGLFPVLRRTGFLPVYVRLDHDEDSPPHAEQVRQALLAECAAKQVEAPPPLDGEESLWELLHRAYDGFWDVDNHPVTPVLVIDQFEEIFTLGMMTPGRQERSRAFMAELGALIDNRPPRELLSRLELHPDAAENYAFAQPGCRMVLSFREDFLPELGRLRQYTRSTFQNYLRLLRMRGDTAVGAIQKTGGTLVEPDVARAIVCFLARVPAAVQAETDLATVEVDPALLSLVCRELNTRRQKATPPLHTIPLSLLDVSKTEILETFYNESFVGMKPGVRVFVEEELLTRGGYRDAPAVEDALLMPDVDAAALNALVARRLIRREERFGTPRIELTHDVLTDVVRDSRDRRHAEEEATRRRREQEEAAHAREAALRAQGRRIAAAVVLVLAAAAAFAVWSTWRAREIAGQKAELASRDSALVRKDTALAQESRRVLSMEQDLADSTAALRRQRSDLATSRAEVAANEERVRAMLLTTREALQRADVSERVALVGAEAADYYLDVTGRAVRRQAAQSTALNETAGAKLDSASSIVARSEERLRRSAELEAAVRGVLCAAQTGPRSEVRAAVDSLLPGRKLCAEGGRTQSAQAAGAQGRGP